MSLSTVRTALTAKVAGVSGVNKVYDYRRYWTDEATFVTKTVTSSKVQWWTVSLKRRTLVDSASLEGIVYFTFEILGFYGLVDADASEKTFHALVEDVCEALSGDLELGGVCEAGSPEGQFQTVGMPDVELGEGDRITLLATPPSASALAAVGLGYRIKQNG